MIIIFLCKGGYFSILNIFQYVWNSYHKCAHHSVSTNSAFIQHSKERCTHAPTHGDNPILPYLIWVDETACVSSYISMCSGCKIEVPWETTKPN